MAIVSLEDAQLFLDNDEASEEEIIGVIINTVEAWVQSHCRRTFSSTSYSLEQYDGNGTKFLTLRNFPITALSRLIIGREEALKICNTSSTTWASVSVTSTGLVLVKDGTSDATVLFATYTTLSNVATAINALGSGWSAEVLSTSLNSIKSTDLLETYGLSCIDSSWVDLCIPYRDAETDFKVHSREGQITLTSGGVFPEGTNNIFVTFTAGYSAATMPSDLKTAILIIIKYLYQRREEEAWGLKQFTLSGLQNSFEWGEFPKEARLIINQYRRLLI